MNLRRGFKSEAERKAKDLRRELNLRAVDPLPARRLAEHLELLVLPVNRLPEADGVSETLSGDSGWSAVTITDFSSPAIIYNPTHSAARQESNFMHEMAHLIEGHKPSGLDLSMGLPCRSYNKEQEDEAAWLGGCLQIPRTGMLWAVKRRMSNSKIARYYTASEQMVQFRRNVTGVDYQLKNRY